MNEAQEQSYWGSGEGCCIDSSALGHLSGLSVCTRRPEVVGVVLAWGAWDARLMLGLVWLQLFPATSALWPLFSERTSSYRSPDMSSFPKANGTYIVLRFEGRH